MLNTFSSENHAVYEIMRKNLVEPDRSRMTVWHMRIAYGIPKAMNIHSEYVIPNCFFAASIVTRTRLNITLYLCCLSCWDTRKSVNKCHVRVE